MHKQDPLAKCASVVAVILGLVLFAGSPAVADTDKYIVVQSTTSTQNSGLLDYLLPIFKKNSGIDVRVVAVGTGQAIKNARNGDGDVLLVHAKKSEEQFVADGWGVRRFDVMYNDFVIVGAPSDLAEVGGMKNAQVAMKKIASAKASFASRGDDSGTHKKELSLWKAARVDATSASGSWYRETGSGMGATLNTGVGMDAYVLTDRATWISFKNKGNFRILVEGGPNLFNQYGVILVNSEKHPKVKEQLGKAFIDWLTGSEGQAAIASFKINGQQLFFPNAKRG